MEETGSEQANRVRVAVYRAVAELALLSITALASMMLLARSVHHRKVLESMRKLNAGCGVQRKRRKAPTAPNLNFWPT